MTKFWILFFVFITFSNADIYYLDAENGNDFSSGKSPKSAWKSIKKLNGFRFKPGDTISFKRGSVFRGYFIVSSSGNKNKPIVFTSYGKGDLPVITSMKELPGSKIPENWENVDGKNIWSFNLNFNPQRILIDDKEVLRAGKMPLEIDGRKIKWFWNNNKLYVYSEQNPAFGCNSIKINIRYETVLVKNKHNIIFQNLDIQGGNGYALAIRGSHDIVVKNCTIGGYSRMGLQIMDNKEESRFIPSHDVIVENCLVDSKFHFKGYKAPSTRGSIDGVLLNSGAHDCIVRNNRIKDWGHTGINIVAINRQNPGVYNNKFYNNYITGENLSYSRGIGIDGVENRAHHNEFFYNIIKNTTVRSQLNGDHNRFYHNIIDTVKNSPIKPYGTAQGIEIQGYGKNYVSHDNTIDNNVIIDCEEAGIRIRAGENDKYNNFVRNNIIYNCGINSKDKLEGIGLIIDNHKSIKKNIFLNNCIYNPKNPNKIVFYRGKFLNIKEFNAKNKIDKISNNIQKDPKFIDVKKRDLHLKSSSPCIDAGIAVEKNYRFKGKSPDIGFYEER